MERQKVKSSNIASIGYDRNTLTLEVEFNNGATYQYSQVPESVYNELMVASSHGQFLNANIKNNYAYERVG